MAGPSLRTLHGVQESNLPSELMEHVLSYLSLPVLCRMRTVCKLWNHIICNSSFHDSWEKRDHGVCFLTRFESSNGYTKIDRSMRGTTCFLDLEERRWYLIKGSVDQRFDTRNVAMGDGLVAEFCSPVRDEDSNYYGAPTVCCIQISDPIVKMRWMLDRCPIEVKFSPSAVVAADRGSCIFRLFLFDNSGFAKTRVHQCLWIYESSTNKWRCASQPPRKGSYNNFARSAVVYQQGLYIIFTPNEPLGRFLALYDIEKDTWSMVLENLPEAQLAELVVSRGKLFIMFWRSASTSSRTMMLEMVEIQVLEKTSRIVFQIPASTLSQHFYGEQISKYNFPITCLALRLNSNSLCGSLVLFSNLSGKVIIYNVASATADILPEHPLGDTKLVGRSYWAKYMNLCSRDILRKDAQSHPPVYVPK
ncbi:hypothetical protein KC19_5G052000 [Ceratodon purpureus]|uniref:F-box domain-containing protein n=1 Tax=Ceratodon purpureus TaxID=3225 RepID=A0A8T0HZF1_CERPU|nr:hypothetical protein KC19_5G052000 [Ceratodon purpureus]